MTIILYNWRKGKRLLYFYADGDEERIILEGEK